MFVKFYYGYQTIFSLYLSLFQLYSLFCTKCEWQSCILLNIPWLVTSMDYKKNTLHVVIQFDEKTIDGKHCFDLVPISWTYMKNSKLYCKYPNKKEYKILSIR